MQERVRCLSGVGGGVGVLRRQTYGGGRGEIEETDRQAEEGGP